MKTRVNRQTIDLSAYPDLVVIYLGMRANKLRGLKTLMRLKPEIQKAVAAEPEGLLLHEDIMFSLFPLHVGMRQYWQNFDSLERWARSLPHQGWWLEFLRNAGGTGFWHEIYSMQGGMEAIYNNMPVPVGMMKFTPKQSARGTMFSARERLNLAGAPSASCPRTEAELYADAETTSKSASRNTNGKFSY